MPVVKKPGTKSCYKVKGTSTPESCLSHSEATKQEQAIYASKARRGKTSR